MARIGFVQLGFDRNDPRCFMGFSTFDVSVDSVISFSAAEMFELVWRVKRVRVGFTGFTVDGTPPSSTSSTTGPNAVSSEADIPCVLAGGDFFIASGEIAGGLLVNVSIILDECGYNPSSRRFSPDIAFETFGFIISGTENGRLTTVPDVFSNTPSAATLTFLGISVPLYEPAGHPCQGQFIVEAIEYWEYRDSNEQNPVWDAVTGEQLIVPAPGGD